MALGLQVPNPPPSIAKLREPRSGEQIAGVFAALDTVIVEVAPEKPPTMIMAPRNPDCKTFSTSPVTVLMIPWINPDTPRSTTELAQVTATFVRAEMVERLTVAEASTAWTTCAAHAPWPRVSRTAFGFPPRRPAITVSRLTPESMMLAR